MKTTIFFSEIKKVANDSTLERMFDYGVNHEKKFYEILLHGEPSKKILTLCEKNGFSIRQNITNVWVNEVNGEWKRHTVWEVIPIDANDIEYVTNDDTFQHVNENVIIATDQAMIDAGMIKCNPREGQLTLWAYMLNHVWNEWQWTPIMRVFDKPLTEDLTDEDGRVIEHKSTHKIGNFYGALVYDNFDFTRFLESYNINAEKL